MQKGFTLLELLIVIAILAILTTVVILVMNPAESIKRARDTQRISDLDSIKTAIILYITEGNVDIGATTCLATPVCYSDLCKGAACGEGKSPSNNNGNGWIPIAFTGMAGGAPLSRLPTDPVNSDPYRYAYAASGTDFELNANMESDYFTTKNPVEANDGGNDPNLYEVGTNLTIISPAP